MNSRALKGQKKRFSLKYDFVDKNKPAVVNNENYPIKPKTTLDMELDDINELESDCGINYALHSIRPEINQIEFSRHVRDSFVKGDKEGGVNTRGRKSTSLKFEDNVSGAKKSKTKNMGGPSGAEGTEAPKEMRDFRFRLDDIQEISKKAFQFYPRMVNKGKIQIEIHVPDSNFYSPNFQKICPLPFDVEQTERGLNLEIHYGLEKINLTKYENVLNEKKDYKIQQKINIPLKELTQNEFVHLTTKIITEYQKIWRAIVKHQSEETELKVRITHF